MHKDLEYDAERPPHRGARAPADAGVAPRAAPYSPVGLLDLQRLAGNRAVSALAAEPATVVQRLATRTGLKKVHAEKVLYNHLKGDPPFKPQRGNFGAVSWFAGSGNPYVGGQAQSYDVTVDVTINPDPAQLPATYFRDFVRNYVQRTHANLKDQSTHHDFWVALGKSLEGGGAQEVPIDQSDVSKQGGGTFVVVGGSARETIALANADQLSTDLGGGQAMTSKLQGREGKRASSFQVVFDRVPPNDAQAGVPLQLLAPLVTRPTRVGKDEKNIPGMGWGGQRVAPSVTVTFTLAYATYASARVQAKRLATAIDDGRLAGRHVAVHGGAGWSASASRSYRA